jgi:hypothetical protein
MPSIHPDVSYLPGSGTLLHLVNGVGALVALVLGAVAWAFGSHSHNVHQAVAGRRAVLVSSAAALLIGAAPVLINFFFDAGHGLH